MREVVWGLELSSSSLRYVRILPQLHKALHGIFLAFFHHTVNPLATAREDGFHGDVPSTPPLLFQTQRIQLNIDSVMLLSERLRGRNEATVDH